MSRLSDHALHIARPDREQRVVSKEPPNEKTALDALFALAPFSPNEKSRLLELVGLPEPVRPGTQLIPEGAPLNQPRLVVSGWGCRARALGDGRRQILCFYLPGDFMGFSPRDAACALGTYMALTGMETVSAAPVIQRRGAEGFSNLDSALARLQTLEEYYLLAQIARIGRQTAYERFANLMLEFYDRLHRAGRASENSFHMPLTQEVLSDGLGLSIVHVNRTVQQLKREGLISASGSTITLLKPELLASIADFRAPRISGEF